MTQLTRHFKSEEFACKCCGVSRIDHMLVERLERMRLILDYPLIVTSGFRCVEHNKAVGGAQDSYHLDGKAVDLALHTSTDRFALVQAAFAAGFERIGVYKRWIHLDVGDTPTRVLWIG